MAKHLFNLTSTTVQVYDEMFQHHQNHIFLEINL